MSISWTTGRFLLSIITGEALMIERIQPRKPFLTASHWIGWAWDGAGVYTGLLVTLKVIKESDISG